MSEEIKVGDRVRIGAPYMGHSWTEGLEGEVVQVDTYETEPGVVNMSGNQLHIKVVMTVQAGANRCSPIRKVEPDGI